MTLMTTTRTNQSTLSEGAIEEFQANLRGRVITPADAGYDDARALWNGLIDKRPALIAQPSGVADVISAVEFARTHALPVAIRGGGHNVAGTAMVDDGLVIDLSRLKSIRVDPDARRVRAEPGVTWGELDRETQVFGLATPGGEVSVTGIAGLTLGGGMGVLRRKHGLSCDNLMSVDLVTMEGQFLTASADEHPDLFWGIRGGGGNFGVVTSFEFALHPVGPEIYEANIWYPFEQAGQVMRSWREFTDQAPDEVTSIALIWSIPTVPDFPEELHGKPVVIIGGVYAGAVEDGQRALSPLREFGEPIFDLSGPTTYMAVQTGFDPFLPDGLLCYWKSIYVDELDDSALDLTLARGESRPSPSVLIAIRHMGGAVSRVGEDESAYAHRTAKFLISFDACWLDSEATDEHIAWTRAAWSDIERVSGGGVYVNFAGFGEDGEALMKSIHGRNYERLVALKRRYDPMNLLSSSLNVTASSETATV